MKRGAKTVRPTKVENQFHPENHGISVSWIPAYYFWTEPPERAMRGVRDDPYCLRLPEIEIYQLGSGLSGDSLAV